jgi:CHAT domain-containing protein
MARRDKSEYLFAMFEPQSRLPALLVEAGRLKDKGELVEAAKRFTEIEQLLRALIEIHQHHNADYPESPMSIEPLTSSLGTALMMHADAIGSLGDGAGAEALRTAAIDLAQRSESPQAVANRRRDRAAALAADSRYHEAISELLDARATLEAANDELGAVRVTAQLAETYEWLGDIARARDEAASARATLDPRLPAGGPSMEGILDSVLGGQLEGAELQSTLLAIWVQLVQLEGRLSRDLGDHARARAAFESAVPRVVTVAKPAVEFQLARIDIEAGEVERGYRRLCELEPMFQGLLAQKRGVLQSWQAEALLRLGRLDEALELARAGAESIARQNDLDGLWRAQWRVARCFLALKNYRQDAYRWALAATTTIGSLRRAPLGFRLDSTYLADKLPVFEAALDLAIELEDVGAACRLSDSIKSRGLTSVLRTEQAAPADDPRFASLTTEIDRLDHLVRDAWSPEIEARRNALLAERAEVIEQIRIRDPRWRAVTEAPSLDLDALQRSLALDKTAALSLYWHHDRVIAMLITPDDIVAETRVLAPQTIADIETYRAVCSADNPAAPELDPAVFEGLAAARLVPERILDRALEIGSVIVVPHRALHILPWAALKHRGRRLFEYATTSVSPNLSSIALLRSQRASVATIGLIGGPTYPDRVVPLLLASSELAVIARHYETAGGNVVGNVIEGDDATSAAFVALATSPSANGGVLHVICHGEFFAGEPMRSSLLFSDGKVDAATISRLQLRFEEVVLSACSTGYRPTEVNAVSLSGDDIVGLVASFMEAGASTVLVSIPTARGDAVHRFMSAYHKQRAANVPPRIAYRDALRTMAAEAEFSPSLWAGFTLYGG